MYTTITESTLTASAALAELEAGDTTSERLVEGLLERIDRLNPQLNAIITLDGAGARQRAKAADEARQRGECWGPLHGLPITIKDAFETAGMRTVSGYPPFSGHVPEKDAPPVARLRQAGAIIVGKTNLPTLANGIQCDNPVFGRTNNPWDLQRTPGGSSGGAAAALAASLSFLELGSDIGGSLRIPAHFCGVYSLKLTASRVSGQGHLASPKALSIPAGWEGLLKLASFGPMARSIDDLRLAFPIIAEPGTPGLEPAPANPPAEMRLAWSDDFGGAPLDDATRRAMRMLATAVEHAGGRVEHLSDPGFDFQQAWRAAGTCLGTINTLFQPLSMQWQRRLTGPILGAFGPRDALMQGLFAGMSLRPAVVREALERQLELIDQLEASLSRWDAWICPVFPTSAFTHRPPNAPIEVDDAHESMLLANLLHNVIFNLTGHPVVTIPIGRNALGLPIGVQVVGRRWQEMALLNAAERLAGLTDGFQPPPGN